MKKFPAESIARAEGVSRPAPWGITTWGAPPPAGRSRRSAVPGVKTLREPVATACKPCRMFLPEMESVSLIGALRSPGRVGLKRMKTWQVLGIAPAGAGLSAPLHVLLVMLKSGPEVAERLTF